MLHKQGHRETESVAPLFMSRSRGKLHKAECCPWCGTRTLLRDNFHAEGYAERGASFICTTCSTGFLIRDSPRTQFAKALFARDRQLRPPEERIRQQLQIPQGGCLPLTQRPMEELRQIERLLTGKQPHTKTSREHIESSLNAVRNEISRRNVQSSDTTNAQDAPTCQDADSHGQADRGSQVA